MRKCFEFSVPAPIDDVVNTYKSTEFFIDTMKLAGARSIQVVEEEVLPDGGRRWKAEITETSRLPEFLRAADIVLIINESSFHPSKRRLLWRIMPGIRQNIVHLCGEIRILKEDAGVRLVYDVDLRIHLPVIGKKTESLGLQVIGRECRKQSDFLAKRVQERK